VQAQFFNPEPITTGFTLMALVIKEAANHVLMVLAKFLWLELQANEVTHLSFDSFG